MELATLAGGCFWCTEAVFKRLRGVEKVIPGYTGGTTINPSSYGVASGKTGHAEAIQLTFDPKIISFAKILEMFWKLHNPTTLNKQGADTGTEYRSAIFYHSEEQKKIAEASLATAQKDFTEKIVTEITKATPFYEAEEDQIDFYEKNRSAPYCQIVIDPKLQKLYKLSLKEDFEIKSPYKDFKPQLKDLSSK